MKVAVPLAKRLFKPLKILVFNWKTSLKQLQKRQKSKKCGFLGILLGTLGASLLRNMLAVECIVTAGYGDKGQGIVRAGYSSRECSRKLNLNTASSFN